MVKAKHKFTHEILGIVTCFDRFGLHLVTRHVQESGESCPIAVGELTGPPHLLPRRACHRHHGSILHHSWRGRVTIIRLTRAGHTGAGAPIASTGPAVGRRCVPRYCSAAPV